MSNERRHTGDPADPVVSKAYREMSNERTPEHLDHLVLNEARNAAKRRHVTAMAWFRPAAWITTIGLCLAIVLEVADLPLQEQDAFDAPAENEKPYAPQTDAEDAATVPAAESKSTVLQEMERVETVPQPAPGELPESGRMSPDAVREETMPAAVPLRSDTRKEAPAAIEVDALRDADMTIIREAENRARLQAGSDERADGFAQGVTTLGVTGDVAAERYCDEAATENPNTWLDCILELEREGMLEAARIERELLREAFPDAYVPADIEP